MITKLFVIISVFSSIIFNHSTPQQPASQLQITTSSTITNISTTNQTNTYYLYTQKDESGRFWVIDYTNSTKNLQQLKTDLIGHTIDIYYWIDETADDDAQIDHVVIH